MQKDLTGQRFGWLTAIERSGKDKWGNVLWKCRCDCGNEKIVRGANLIAGAVVSCGCAKELSGVTHGGSKTRLYRIWHGIIRRTEDSSRKEYANCGGRGIRICQDWHKSFEAFRDWAMNNGYTDELSICRHDKQQIILRRIAFGEQQQNYGRQDMLTGGELNKSSEPG